MKKKFLSVILILSMLLSFMPVVSNAAASDVTKLTNYITKYGTVNSNGSISLQDKSYDNGYTIATTMTYRSSDNIIIFHFNMSKQGLSCTISFDYDIASQKAKSNKISANYLNDSTFSSVLRQATFDICSYTQNSTLNFTTGTINMNPPSNINETFNDITQAAVASWNKLCYQKAGISIDKIGFDSYYSGNVPTPTSTPTPIPTYTVTYDANGGMDAPSEQTAKSGENITIPSQTPTRKYYDFLGWSTSKTAQTAAYTSGSFMKVTANTTLYAVWQKTPMPDTTGNIITISNAQMKGNTVSFTANLSTAHTMQGEMLIAIYDADGALVDIKSYSAEASKDIAFDKKDNYDTAKVFWWYDTYTMYPMANRAEINLDEVKKIYTITKEFDAACGTVQVTKNNQEVTTAAEGEEIAIEVLPNDGYGVLSTEITDADGNVIELTDNAFTMPKGDIKIKVTFIAIIDSGNFGTNNQTWMLDNNGTFTLSGSGEMQDFTTDNTPWNKYNANIKIVVIEDGITRISKNAFADCSILKRVLINKSVTEIEMSAFKNCVNLRTVEYSGSKSEWEEIYIGSENEQLSNANIIYNSSLSDTLQTDLDYLRYTKNENNAITITDCTADAVKINIPKEIEGLPVTNIGDNAFSGCSNLTSITIPDSVTDISEYAFSSCALTDITIPDSVINIGIGAFSGCDSIKTATIGNNVTGIGKFAFGGCSGIKSITVPDSVKNIGAQAFYDCSGLTNLTVGNNVTTIGEGVFDGCDNLKEVYTTDLAAWCKISFGNETANPIYYAKKLYVNNKPLTELTIPDSVTAIGSYAFCNCEDLTKVTIPSTVTEIGEGAFYNCGNLDSVYISDMTAYLNMKFGNGYSNPMHYATRMYFNNKRVTSLEIPEGIAQIPVYAFNGCDSITRAAITNSVIAVGEGAFEGTNLSDIYYVGTHEEWDAIKVDSKNTPFANANVHFIYSITKEYDSTRGSVKVTANGSEATTSVEGSSIKIEARPNSGYVVRDITVTDKNGNNITVTDNTFTMPDSHAKIKVVFDKEYTIAKEYDSVKGTVTITSQGKEADKAFKGDSMTINATPQSGYVIRSVIVTDNNGQNIAVTDNVFTMPDGNINVKVVFDKEYSISKEYDNAKGTVTITSQNNEADKAFKGDSMTINATPQNGYAVRSVTVTDSHNNNIAVTNNTFIMPESNVNVNVVFDKEYSITKEYDNSKGTVTTTSQNTETGKAFNGNSVTINATPQNGYVVRSVTVTDSRNNNIAVTNNTFTMPEGNVEVNVVFDKEYTITKEYDTTCGMVTTTNNGSEVTVAISGQSIKIETALTDIYSIRSITVTDENGNNISVVENTFTMPESNVTINVVFDRAYQISTYCRGGGAIITTTSSGNETDRALSGDEITINITPNNNCVVLAVIVTNNDGHKFTVTDNKFTMPSSNVIVEALVGEVIASGTCGDNLNWKLTNYFATLIISGEGDMENYLSSSDTPWYKKRKNISNIVIENGVTSIGERAFYDCIGLTSITIPDTVTSIGDGAFWRCSGLTSITIPDSVTSIADRAFDGCSGLTSITIPNGVTSISRNAFSGCSGLTSVAIPDGVTNIGSETFKGCSSLTSITIPDSVTSIGSSAFSSCSNLTSITIPDSVTSIGEAAFSNTTYYDNKDNWENDALYIGNFLIKCNSDALEFDVKEGTKVISDGAFRDCSKLTSVTIPDGVTSIGGSTFDGCSSLTSVTIPDSVTSIGGYAFKNCSGLISITLPDSVTYIGTDAFFGCSGLTSIMIPEGVTSIGGAAFYGCSSLTSITIPDSVTSIGSDAFSNTTYYDNKDNWENDALYIGNFLIKCNSDALEFDVKEGTKVISDGAFRDCSKLTSVTIPDGVTSIGGSTFDGCNGLTSITLPDSVTSIGSSAFSGCSGLTSVTIPDSVTSIGGYAFDGCSGLTSITIPDSVTSIGYGAFYGCSGLTSITIPDSVTSIGTDAFSDCSGLTSITIPDSVTSIGYGAFYGCSGLTSITIPDSVTSIADRAFYGCSGLTNVTIGNSVTSIGDSAFSNCSGLTTIYYTGSKEEWSSITIGDNGNDYLKKANIVYNYVAE